MVGMDVAPPSARNIALQRALQRRQEAQARLSQYESMPINTLADTYLRANTTTEERADILRVLSSKETFQNEPAYRYQDEADIGLFPDLDDPQFIQKLLQKNEFAETVSTFDPSVDPCATINTEFEVTPVQRFVATYLHPRTPYKSMLLYHGVGVGKTCAAIQAAEAYLDVMPRGKVMIVVPKNIKQGFYNAIFDIEKVNIMSGNTPNQSNQCTGDTYLRLTGSMEERDRDVILRRVAIAIKKRYEFYGYTQFANKIKRVLENVPASADPRVQKENEAKALRREFNYTFLIVDEAHNLRDAGEMRAMLRNEEDIDTQGSEDDLSDTSGGKLLTPYLRKVLEYNEGMKFLLMTATPMFNEAREIVFLLNLLIQNDKKQRTISENDVFDAQGNLTESGKIVLGGLATKYISFMRGENPNSFPLRFKPDLGEGDAVTVNNYPMRDIAPAKPGMDPATEIVGDEDKKHMANLPLVRSQVSGEFYEILRDLSTEKIRAEGVGYNTRDSLIQAGNVMFPNEVDVFGAEGFNTCFESLQGGRQFKMRSGSAEWMVGAALMAHSPKVATILRFLNGSRGLCFMYSRFLKAGALFVALVLEANGYTPYGRDYGYLQSGIVGNAGRQCALCAERENGHSGTAGGRGVHAFTPAKYVLLTGDDALSPNNKAMVKACNQAANKHGGVIKVILGSQIAAEGIDLQYIREVHVLDAWFHLNKTEQIIGRGIRYRSHCALDPKERNCTVFLHALDYPMDDSERRETIDMYSYRTALRKAIKMGQVSRTLKEYALDCNLRIGATVLTDKFQAPRAQITSQGVSKNVDVNDVGFTPICDWLENCDYKCKIQVPVLRVSDDSTYTTFSAKFHETRIKKVVQQMFQQKTYFSHDEFQNILAQASNASIPAIDYIIRSIVGNRNFRIRVNSRDGFIIYKNTYYLFQPENYGDFAIPMAIRLADYPVKRDIYSPGFVDMYPQVSDIIQDAVVSGTVTNTGIDMAVFPFDYWNSFVQWVQSLGSVSLGSVETNIPYTETQTYKILLSKINLFTVKFENIRKELMDRLEAITILYKRVDNKSVFAKCVLEYFWDEWLPRSYQNVLIQRSDYSNQYKHVVEENIVESSGRTVRFVNYETGIIDYICDGQACPDSVVRQYTSSARPDPQRTKADIIHSGSPYGYLIYKRGELVFKTQDAKPVGIPPERGQECANDTNTTKAKQKMKTLGEILIAQGRSHLGFTPGEIESPSYSTNQTKACTLLDLALRYMDATRVSNVRWFYRPVSAVLSGHKGITLKAVEGAEAPKRKVKAIKPAGNV